MPHWNRRLIQALLALFLGFGAFPAEAQDRFMGRVVGVPSGDRIRVRLDAWEVTVRLHGVDCPADPPELSERARQYTARRVEGTRVTVQVQGTGSRQTVYGDVFPPSGGSLNEELIRVGLATWARAYAAQRPRLGALEDAARAAGRGMWGDPTGANVPLPPPARSMPKPSVRPAPKASPLSRPKQAPTPMSATPSRRSTRPFAALSRLLPRPSGELQEALRLGATAVAGTAGAATLLFLLWASGWQVRGLPYQALVAACVGGAAALLVPLPLLLLWRRIAVDDTTFLVAAATLLATVSGWLAVSLGRHDRLLRLAPRVPVSASRVGFVRVTGETSAPQGTVYSVAGRIPSIYVREVTQRYEPHAEGRFDRARRSLPHQWVTVYDRITSADFRLTDETGSVDINVDRGKFYALRVARFYNDTPVATFFDTPYSGDTRTEVFFIPVTANVTVWGRRYRSASPLPGAASERMGYDASRDCLVVVEEAPYRAYTGRWQVSLALGLAALVLAGLAAVEIVAPGTIALWILGR